MKTIEKHVVRRYTQGSLEHSILAGLATLAAAEADTIDRLAPVDEFHSVPGPRPSL